MNDQKKTGTALRVGVIHAAMGAVGPLTEAIQSTVPEADVINFVNEEMLRHVNRVGSVDASAMRMFASQVFLAEEACVDLILVACNNFTPRVDAVRPFLTAPLLTVDSAMQEKAAALGGRLGILGTNPNAFRSCCGGIRRAAEAANLPVPQFSDGTVLSAAEALSRSDTDAFDRLLTEKALELVQEGCTAIVLSQVTMARAAAAMKAAGITVPVLTSPGECAAKIAADFT